MPEDDQRLRVSVSDARGRATGGGLGAWLVRAAPAQARGAVSVALVTDRRMRALNLKYRRRDSATDVLSFPAESGVRRGARFPNPAGRLGDIVIARGVARRQAREAGHDESTELRILALHGLLHLLGYDHERDRGRMRRAEGRLRRRARLPQGLLERERTRRGGRTR